MTTKTRAPNAQPKTQRADVAARDQMVLYSRPPNADEALDRLEFRIREEIEKSEPGSEKTKYFGEFLAHLSGYIVQKKAERLTGAASQRLH